MIMQRKQGTDMQIKLAGQPLKAFVGGLEVGFRPLEILGGLQDQDVGK